MKHLFLLLAALVCVNALFAQSDTPAVQQQLTPIDRYLDKDGRLSTPPGFQGSLDPKGFRMATDAKGAPRFLPMSSAAVPEDSSWDDRFGLADLDGPVFALAVSGSDLYAGGGFTTAGVTSANYIAKWNGSSWSALGIGMNNYVWALAVSGSGLCAGGDFTTAGGKPSTFFGRWIGPVMVTPISPSSGAIGTSVAISGSGFSSTPGNNIVYFGGVRATVTTAIATSLAVTVPIGATYAPISVTKGWFDSTFL